MTDKCLIFTLNSRIKFEASSAHGTCILLNTADQDCSKEEWRVYRISLRLHLSIFFNWRIRCLHERNQVLTTLFATLSILTIFLCEAHRAGLRNIQMKTYILSTGGHRPITDTYPKEKQTSKVHGGWVIGTQTKQLHELTEKNSSEHRVLSTRQPKVATLWCADWGETILKVFIMSTIQRPTGYANMKL